MLETLCLLLHDLLARHDFEDKGALRQENVPFILVVDEAMSLRPHLCQQSQLFDQLWVICYVIIDDRPQRVPCTSQH